jgi:hypothetical protein
MLLGLLALALGGCAHLSARASEVAGRRDVALRYEGTCTHLACCSIHAVAVPAGTQGAFRCEATAAASCSRNAGWFAPGFTCDPHAQERYRQPHDPPYLSCNDQERWLALPGLSRAQCGERYLVCRHGIRVTAVVRDRSAGNRSGHRHYEGSLGLLRALGADPRARETAVSIYALDERDRIASDPHCVGSGT